MVFRIKCSEKEEVFTLMKAFAKYDMNTSMHPVYECIPQSMLAFHNDAMKDNITEVFEVSVYSDDCSDEHFKEVFHNILFIEHKDELQLSGEYYCSDCDYGVVLP